MKIATLRIARPALLALILLAYAPEAYCVATLKIPLNFDSGFIRDSLLQQIFTGPGEQRTIVDEDWRLQPLCAGPAAWSTSGCAG